MANADNLVLEFKDAGGSSILAPVVGGKISFTHDWDGNALDGCPATHVNYQGSSWDIMDVETGLSIYVSTQTAYSFPSAGKVKIEFDSPSTKGWYAFTEINVITTDYSTNCTVNAIGYCGEFKFYVTDPGGY